MKVLIALGANAPGPWGSPAQSLLRARAELERAGLAPIAASRVLSTRPVASNRQPNFANAVILVNASLGPAQLLRLLKRLERAAGRRPNGRNMPRPLDLDIVDMEGRRLGWRRHETTRARLTLPHPLAHRRGFVLVPLLEVAPQWWHSGLRTSGRRLLARLAPSERRGILGPSRP